MKQANPITVASEKDAAIHGIITDKQRLLSARHWAGRLNLFSRRAARSVLLGNTRSRFRGRGMEFEEVRRYQPGDDIRTIDWKVTARKPGAYTKLFREERERPCHIIIDQRSALFFGSGECFKSVLAAELGTALAWAAITAGDRVGAQIIADTTEVDIRARNSRKVVLKLIDSVHTLNSQLLNSKTSPANTPNPLSYYLDECLRIVRPGSAVFVISDFHDINERCTTALNKIGRHTDITLFQIFDPLEESLPMSGLLPISNGEEITNIRMSVELNNSYKRLISQRESRIRDTAVQTNSHLMKIATSTSARKALTRVYRT